MNRGFLQKLNNSYGFSLAETLVAVLILLMVSAVVAGGIPAAVNAYTKAVDAANAQVLLSTTVNALRNELSTARDVNPIETNKISYESSYTGSRSIISIENGIEIMEYADRMEDVLDSLDDSPPAFRPLVSNAAKDGFTVICDGGITVYNDTVVFSDLQVTKENSEVPIASMSSDLVIRLLKR